METDKRDLLTKEQRLHNRQIWSEYHRRKVEGQTWHHLLYILLRGKDPLVAYQPLKNPKKIEAWGGDPYVSLQAALKTLHVALLVAFDPGHARYREAVGLKDNQIMLAYSAFTGEIKHVGEYRYAERKEYKDLFFHVTPEMADHLKDKIKETLERVN